MELNEIRGKNNYNLLITLFGYSNLNFVPLWGTFPCLKDTIILSLMPTQQLRDEMIYWPRLLILCAQLPRRIEDKEMHHAYAYL